MKNLLLKCILYLSITYGIGFAVPALGQIPDSLYAKMASNDLEERSEGLHGIALFHATKRGGTDSAIVYINLLLKTAEESNSLRYHAIGNAALAAFALSRKEFHEAIRLNALALDSALSDGDSIVIGQAARQLATGYMRIEDFKQGVKYYQQAASFIDVGTYPDKYVDTKANEAIALSRLGQVEQALQVYEDLLLLLDQGVDIKGRGLSKLYNSISGLYTKLERYDLAKQYATRAVEIKQVINDRYGEMVAWSKLADISRREGVYSDAEAYGLRAMQIADSLNRPGPIIALAIELAELYIDNEQNAKAEKYVARAIRIAEATDKPTSLGSSYLMLSRLYYEKGDINGAMTALDRAERFVANSDDLGFKMAFYDQQSKIAERARDYRLAMSSRDTYYGLRDSMFSIEKSRAIAELEAEYELVRKENEIALLTKDAELQEVNTAKLKQRQGLLLGGGLALLIFTGLLINRYRSKQRTLQTISQQNEEITARSRENELLVREIHHRVKNNMAIMQGLLQAQRERHTHNNELEEALLVCEGQLSSMALIHQDLYRTNNFMAVDAEDYFTKLLQNIQSAYAERSRAIAFKVQLSKQELQVHQAVPLGLIMNELVTNAVKYAFPDRQPGAKIEITQNAVGEELVLAVRDNGVGLAAGRAQRVSTGFGLSMVKGLTRQLGGHLRQEDCDGTCFEVVVPLASFTARDAERSPAAAPQAAVAG